MSVLLEQIADVIANIQGVESANPTSYGTVYVVLEHGFDRKLRQEILDIGESYLVPIQVFYRMPDGRIIGEHSKKSSNFKEWVDEFYTPINVPGYLGTDSNAPPEQVAREVDGAKKLLRVRASTRGKPVVAWRYGSSEIKAGSIVRFEKETSLQWTMGRMLTVKPGSMGTVDELSSRRPIAFIRVGEFDNVELPIHMLGSFFNMMPNSDVKKEDKDFKNRDKNTKRNLSKEKSAAMISPELDRVMQNIGVGAIGYGRDPEKDDVPANQPYFRDKWQVRGNDTSTDQATDEGVEIDAFTIAEVREWADEEDDMLLKHRPVQRKSMIRGKPVLLNKKF